MGAALMLCAVIAVGGLFLLSVGRVPVGVEMLGQNLSLRTADAASGRLSDAEIVLQDGSRRWVFSPSQLGVSVDIGASVRRAQQAGYGGLLGGQSVAPVATLNADVLRAALTELAAQTDTPAQNASVQWVEGRVQAVSAQIGRRLDVDATLNSVAQNFPVGIADGRLTLLMQDVQPAILDASPLVAQAEALLASPLRVQVWDPFTDARSAWVAQPSQWGMWLSAVPDANSPLGLRLALNAADVRTFLTSQAGVLAAHQRLNLDEAVANIQMSVQAFNLNPQVRLYETDRTHTVRAGETITSIAYAYGIPYPYIQQANGNISSLSVGAQIVIPSREVFLELPPVPNKRVVVSISGNWTKVYEDGALKWEWVSSTGIRDSPTWTGVYQILLHEENSYAGNWNLWMPYFLGVYKPIPGSDFTNGFHGFPTRGGGQILWENSLGTRVTYGCILLSNTNARLLYEWAENGVMVEILP